MGWLGRVFGQEAATPPGTPEIDVELRRAQLIELEESLTALILAMSQQPSPVHNPGWQGKIRDYAWMRKQVGTLLSGTITHDGIYDLILGVQPVFRGDVPAELAFIEPLQARVLDAIRAMQAG